MQVNIIKQTHKETIPAGQLEFKQDKVILKYNDYLLMRVLKALFSRSICSKCREGDKTTKKLHVFAPLEVLRFIKRPFFFDDKDVTHNWKYQEIIA